MSIESAQSAVGVVASGANYDEAIVSLTAALKEGGASLMTSFDLIAELNKCLAATGKPGAAVREAGCKAIASLSSIGSNVEPYLIQFVSTLLPLTSDKFRPVQIAAKAAFDSIIAIVSPNGLAAVVPSLLVTSAKWQVNFARLEGLMLLNKNAPIQMARSLVDIIPNVAELMWSTKAEVKNLARDAMGELCGSVDNRDIKTFIPQLINAIENPKEVIETIHLLAGIVFVQTVDCGALSIMSPILIRGFAERKVATKRQCARIVENMTKLVDEPSDVQPFVPKLLPLLEKAQNEVSDPECREVCQKAHTTLLKKSDPTKYHVAKLNNVETMYPVVEGFFGAASVTPIQKLYLEHVCVLALSLMDIRLYEGEVWQTTLGPIFEFIGCGDVAKVVADILEECIKDHTPEPEVDEDEDAEELCNCNFSLAYGTKILLNNTYLKLKRGLRYGLIGQNDCGKTSLLRAISNGKVEGFPDASEVLTIFVETDIQGELSDLTVLDYIFADKLLKNSGVSREDMATTLQGVGFNDDSPANIDSPVGSLSGGWKMKLALARAMLLKADILLLDEPTNHLDVYNVKWVEDYLNGLVGVTCIMVSHDAGFLDRVCTNIIYIDSLKLSFFKGNLNAFIELNPEAKKHFEVAKVDKEPFSFPEPGNLEGINTKGKPILKMSDISFTYPGAAKAQLNHVTVRCSLSSRVACVGVNGAGKSTMIKLLTGELEPDEGSGEVWKHPNARIAYVAQHAFHHIENHTSKTANEYIRWRYQYGKDKEALEKVTMIVTEEEKIKMATPINYSFTDAAGNSKKEKVIVKKLTEGRRQVKKEYEYEVEFVGKTDLTFWLPIKTLMDLGWEKVIKDTDESIAQRAASFTRALSIENVEKHLEGFGLHREFGTHTRIAALSGGQKVKVVLAACMWNCPHLLILDEPTNYLDRESLAQLSAAIEKFEGGCVMITHNNDFCENLCPEVWHLENNTLNLKGDPEWMKNALSEKIEKKAEATEMVDAMGNVIKLKPKKKAKMSRAEKKKKDRIRKLRLAQGLDVSSDEDED